MANGWSDERRARQSEAIHRWKPWQLSTGARTPEGKARSSRNAFRLTIRKCWLFACYLSKQRRKLDAGLPYASIDEVELMERLRGYSK